MSDESQDGTVLKVLDASEFDCLVNAGVSEDGALDGEGRPVALVGLDCNVIPGHLVGLWQQEGAQVGDRRVRRLRTLMIRPEDAAALGIALLQVARTQLGMCQCGDDHDAPDEGEQ